jgi:hypothetical protein
MNRNQTVAMDELRPVTETLLIKVCAEPRERAIIEAMFYLGENDEDISIRMELSSSRRHIP